MYLNIHVLQSVVRYRRVLHYCCTAWHILVVCCIVLQFAAVARCDRTRPHACNSVSLSRARALTFPDQFMSPNNINTNSKSPYMISDNTKKGSAFTKCRCICM